MKKTLFLLVWASTTMAQNPDINLNNDNDRNMKKYFALVWIVLIPGNNSFAKESLSVPMPNSSTVPSGFSKSSTDPTLSR